MTWNNCSDIVDGWHYFLNRPFPSISIEVDNEYHRNCNRIKKELCKNGIEAKVSRYRLFDVDLFLLDISKNNCRFFKRDVADALGISLDWIEIYTCSNGLDVYAVLEDKLIEKYGDCKGELHFKDDFDFMKVFNGSSNGYNISQRLKEKGICVKNLCANYNCVTLNSSSNGDEIADALNIPKIAVSDLRCHNADITHIILVDRCKE